MPSFSRLAVSLPALLAITAGMASAEGISITSQVDSLKVVATDKLPKNPKAEAIEPGCAQNASNPKTEAGKKIQALGWSVTSELETKAGTLVNFVGGAEFMGGSGCAFSDGNIGVFKGDTLRGLIYAQAGDDTSIGSVWPLEDGDARIWSGMVPSQPLADLRVSGADGITIQPIAAEERLCGDRVVPKIYGLPITTARETLAAAGWTPVPYAPEGEADDDPVREALAKAGFPEVEACAGSGLGFCNLIYTDTAGHQLNVSTMDGEPPSVIGYDSHCG